MQNQGRGPKLSPISLVIILGAIVKFTIHLYTAPGYGFFGDELYTIALSKHLAFGYVDLPPLVPALVALSRALFGESLFAMHIVPALAGAFTLVFTCLCTKEFGGKTFAVALSALGFIVVPIWLGVNSIFCYDSIDQLVLSGFLYVLVRFLSTGNRKLWILLGLIAGVACMTKMTILFLGPGFLAALLISKYRRDLLTPWPWLGAALCLVVITPYLLWQFANDWPTLEYWRNYSTYRLYETSLLQYFTNLFIYMHLLLLPLWAVGLYRIFRTMNGTNYSFLGLLFLFTLALMFALHAAARMLAEVFIPLLAAGAVFVEEKLARMHWQNVMKTAAIIYLLAVGVFSIPASLPVVPPDRLPAFAGSFTFLRSLKEFNGISMSTSPLLSGRIGWEELVRDVAEVYEGLPPEDRKVAGIYAEWYMPAGAIDQLGPPYGLPHAVSESLTYYLWGPGYSWDVMIVVARKGNTMAVLFEECELKAIVQHEFDLPTGQPYIYVCRGSKAPADTIWRNMKFFR